MEDQRTIRQNAALHLLYKLIAQEAKEKGITVKVMASKLPDADIPVTEVIVKEFWRIFQDKILDKHSTAKLTKKEIDEVYEPFAKFLSENFDITIDFPSWEMWTLKEE